MEAIIWQSFFYFCLALGFALMEIEIEGKNGWAANLPTFLIANKFLPGKRPITGYWLFSNSLIFLFFHQHFFSGAVWTWDEEVLTVSRWLLFLPTWDFLWFVLNPHFKLKKFHREKIWWHEKIIWIFGLMPWDYFLALNLSIGLIFIFNPLNQTFSEQLTYPGVQLFLTLLTIIFSPLYHRLYWRLRK